MYLDKTVPSPPRTCCCCWCGWW